MTVRDKKTCGPAVTVLMSTYNRRHYLAQAIASIVGQDYNDLEIIIVRDGGDEVSDIVSRFDDNRIKFLDRDYNLGKAASFNEALTQSSGEYVCYLDDDDIFYPHHVSTLVEAIDGQDEYGLVYSDLYKTWCKELNDRSRVVLAKNVEVCRDFDRWAMLHYNHALHVSIMHRRDLLIRAGMYDEQTRVMIDWDLTRKLCFYTDFKHVPVITGQFYAPVHDNDRISVRGRKNRNEYMFTLFNMRSSRPPRPWDKISDLDVIVLAQKLDEKLVKLLTDIWSHGFYPHRIYLPLTEVELRGLRTVAANIVGVPVQSGCDIDSKLSAAMEVCDSDYIAVVSGDYRIDKDESMWVEKSLHALMNCRDPMRIYELIDSGIDNFSAVFRSSQLRRAIAMSGEHTLSTGIAKAGYSVVKPVVKEYPMQLDHIYRAAEYAQNEGRFSEAVKYYSYLRKNYGNRFWLGTKEAAACFDAGDYERTIALTAEINAQRPSVATLMLQARACMKMNMVSNAIEFYNKALEIMEYGQREFFDKGMTDVNFRRTNLATV